MRLIIISNRLPVRAQTDEHGISFIRSEGGLATGLGSLETKIEKHWIGWPGLYAEDDKQEKHIRKELKKQNFHPVFLNPDQIENFYEGYSNKVIWPLCHYFFAHIEYKTEYWEAYQEVNKLFSIAANELIQPDDIVWVQDYQLMLLPGMIRKEHKELSIGYFHHIPFPSYELFRVLPERAEILEGLIGADLIAFHTHDYMRHFISSAYRVLDLDFTLDEAQVGNRVVHVDTFPMGINFDLYHDTILKPEVKEIATTLHKEYGNEKLILSVDRLDYSKGIVHRLNGFEQFLENNPEYKEKVSLAMIVVPSRDSVDIYADLKTSIEQTISNINGKYATMNWTPIHYFYRSFPFEELIAMYHIADIGLVTPLRDGMNLVAKEYVATKRDNPGVLILSEMAGAAIELTEALIVNPNDAKAIENAILQAIEMPEGEQFERIQQMQEVISRQTVNKWADDFFQELTYIKQQTSDLQDKQISRIDSDKIINEYKNAKKRLIILDYDGTLAPFRKRPQDAAPSEELLSILRKLAADEKNTVVISSGRDHQTLDKWLGDLPILFAAEHGAFFKEDGVWHENISFPQWNDEIIDIFQQITNRTPKSKIEIKKTAIVWHYRNTDAWLADLRVKQLINRLINPCSRLNLQVMRGNKIVEIKSPDFSKGTEAKRLLAKDNYDYVMAMGDDVTDDDMFHALPDDSITIKIGENSDYAKYNLAAQRLTLPFLRSLLE